MTKRQTADLQTQGADLLTPAAWLAQVLLDGIPTRPEKSVVARAERFMRLPGSAMSSRFDARKTPWSREPIECSGDGITRKCTFVAPVQSGKSVAGEVVLCDRLIHQTNGDIQYNWQNDTKALERWFKRIEPILLSIDEIMRRTFDDRNKWTKGLVAFPHLNLTVQGVFTDSNVASDSIRCQVNEEIHDSHGGWSSGRLAQAYGRLTAYWDSYVFNISNAGYVGDQLEGALKGGTYQHWLVQCPGCSEYHQMRTEWNPKRPDLGGLRYDSAGCKYPDGSYNYNKLESTVRFQMPCGYEQREDRRQREALSQSGHYSAPTNPGAHITERSFTLDGISVDYIPYLQLVQEKHAALKAMRYGDPDKYSAYVRERECRFWDPNDRPLVGNIILSAEIKKDRNGLPGRCGRYFALDHQQGEMAKGELAHWWLVIRDGMPNGDSRLVFEGKVETDENAIEILDRHECVRSQGAADSGDETTIVYQFCLRYGINAIKGSGEPYFSHGPHGKKIFSPEKPLWQMMNLPGPTREKPSEEPQFWLYSRVGTMDRLSWLRGPDREGADILEKPKWEVPGDVSVDYQHHMEAWELQDKKAPNGNTKRVWVQLKKRDDLYKCETYIAMLMEMAELIGVQTE